MLFLMLRRNALSFPMLFRSDPRERVETLEQLLIIEGVGEGQALSLSLIE
jgi:hypothetical protein